MESAGINLQPVDRRPSNKCKKTNKEFPIGSKINKNLHFLIEYFAKSEQILSCSTSTRKKMSQPKYQPTVAFFAICLERRPGIVSVHRERSETSKITMR